MCTLIKVQDLLNIYLEKYNSTYKVSPLSILHTTVESIYSGKVGNSNCTMLSNNRIIVGIGEEFHGPSMIESVVMSLLTHHLVVITYH